MILELAVVAGLAARCAPSVAFETLAAVVRAESGFAPFAIGVNGPGGGPVFPPTREAAVALATDLIERQGRSVDLGLMQVNSANLRPLGLTVADTFEPCRNLAAGARILREGYAAALRTEADPQRALRVALSRYNTGHPERGFANGYVARVQGAAEVVVPAIRLRGEGDGAPRRPATPGTPAAEAARLATAATSPAVLATCGPEPAAWDGWALQAHEGCARRVTRESSPSPSAGGSGAPSVVASRQSPEPR